MQQAMPLFGFLMDASISVVHMLHTVHPRHPKKIHDIQYSIL